MKIIIFGTGRKYEKIREKFRDMEIVALLDNDIKKQNQYLDHIFIDTPDNIGKYKYDYIFIASIYHQQMREQLQYLNVPNEKILDEEHQGIFSDISYVRQYNVINSGIKYLGKVLIFSHALDLSGAPIVLFNLACVLQEMGYGVTVCSQRGGYLLTEYLKREISVHIYEQFEKLDIDHITKNYDMIVVNTVVLWKVVKQFANIDTPVLWWLHEGNSIYKELSLKKSVFPQASNIRVYGVGSRAISAFRQCSQQEKVENLIYGIANTGFISGEGNIKSRKIVFAVIGGVCKQKGQDIFIEAVNCHWENWKNRAEFWIIGSITEEMKIIYEKFNNVIIMGEVEHGQLLTLYKEIDVIVCPSLDDTMPVVLTEGMMNKKVCIASDMTGTATFFSNYENGIVCRAGDMTSLSDAIQWVLDHKDRVSSIGKAAYQIYEREFSLDAFRKNVMKIVKDILKI